MKKFFLILIGIIFLTSCTNDNFYEQSNVKKDIKPMIQKKLPKLADKPDIEKQTISTTLDMDKVLENIDNEIEFNKISDLELKRGWYFAKESDKKSSTPDFWIWIDDGINSRWTSPNIDIDFNDINNKNMCQSTAGVYVYSCIDNVNPNCEYIYKNICRCPDDTKWVDGQGCILLDEKMDFVKITSENLKNGWYYGKKNQKLLNTPSSWICVENSSQSKWRTVIPPK